MQAPILTSRDYFSSLIKAVEGIDAIAMTWAVDELARRLAKTSWVYVVGNGGSASTASHFAADLNKNVEGDPDLFAHSPDSLAALTADANDNCYSAVFTDWLKRLEPDDEDTLIAISTSGKSQNVLDAVAYAKSQGVHTVGLTGFDGGLLKTICDMEIRATGDIIEIVEDCHMAILHSVIWKLKNG